MGLGEIGIQNPIHWPRRGTVGLPELISERLFIKNAKLLPDPRFFIFGFFFAFPAEKYQKRGEMILRMNKTTLRMGETTL